MGIVNRSNDVLLGRLTGGHLFNSLGGDDVCFVTMRGAKSGRCLFSLFIRRLCLVIPTLKTLLRLLHATHTDGEDLRPEVSRRSGRGTKA